MELYNFYSFDSKSTRSQFLTDSVSTIFQKYWRKKVFFGNRSATAILDRGSQVNIKQHMQFNDSRIYLLVCRSS